MRNAFTIPVAIGVLVGMGPLAPPAAAEEPIPTLPCAFVSTAKGAAAAKAYCLKVYNTCNTPIISTARDAQTGEELNTPQIPRGERGQVCGDHPLALVGHTLGGP